MTLLPIVERELRVAARRTGVYRSRCLIPGLVILLILLEWIFTPFVLLPSAMGQLVFGILYCLAAAVCLFEGFRTADSISEERREGTLGLLFLTDLRGYDVVLGKMAGAALAALQGLAATVPVLGLPMLLGGVVPSEYWRMTLALLNILFVSLCAGIFVSSISREQQKALGGAL